MMKKINQARPEGLAQPEIRPGDEWRDKSGGLITVTGYEYNRVTYLREGYEHRVFIRLIASGVSSPR